MSRPYKNGILGLEKRADKAAPCPYENVIVG